MPRAWVSSLTHAHEGFVLINRKYNILMGSIGRWHCSDLAIYKYAFQKQTKLFYFKVSEAEKEIWFLKSILIQKHTAACSSSSNDEK